MHSHLLDRSANLHLRTHVHPAARVGDLARVQLRPRLVLPQRRRLGRLVERELLVQHPLLVRVVDLRKGDLGSEFSHVPHVLVEDAAPQVLLRHLLPRLLFHLEAGRDDQLGRAHEQVGGLHGAGLGVGGGV